MNGVFPGRKRFTDKDITGKVTGAWIAPELNRTAKVVCEQCNNGWMNDIENFHAKPSMSDLAKWVGDVPISQSRANSIALFAFKSAVVIDHICRNRPPFFDRSIRHRFRTHLRIPPMASMWLTGLVPGANGHIQTWYYESTSPPPNNLKLYVLTYSIGHLVIQVTAAKDHGFRRFVPRSEYLAVPFFPKLEEGFVWPPSPCLNSAAEFDQFAARWKDLRIFTA
ncbi:MAG: hypothetical protein AB7O65_09320 [Candidatus Korobacteraceae bacterium]